MYLSFISDGVSVVQFNSYAMGIRMLAHPVSIQPTYKAVVEHERPFRLAVFVSFRCRYRDSDVRFFSKIFKKENAKTLILQGVWGDRKRLYKEV